VSRAARGKLRFPERKVLNFMFETVNVSSPRREIANFGNDDVRNDPDWSAGSLREKYPLVHSHSKNQHHILSKRSNLAHILGEESVMGG